MSIFQLKPLQIAFQRFCYVLMPVLLWLLLGKLGVLAQSLHDAGNLILAVLLFVLGLPLSVFFRVDSLRETFGVTESTSLILLALVIVLLNFMLIAFFARRATLKPASLCCMKPQ